MLPNGTDWNREIIQQVFPHEEARILSLKPSKTDVADKLIWLGTTSGEYTTKSGYLKALELNDTNPIPPTSVEVDWKKGIWNLQTAPKIKLFLWKIFKGALPVGEALAVRNIGSAQTCALCDSNESINHLFLHCDFAYNVCRLAPFSTCIDARGLLDLSTAWLGLCKLTCLPPVGISLGPLAPWILWALWLARNDRIFNNKGTTPEEVITKATAAAQEWLREQGNEPIIRNNPPPQRPLDTAHYACLQSDAAWRSDLHLAGLGWMVTEGHQASSLMSHCFYVSSPLIAEGLALREALFYCIAKGLRAVKCESDSLQLIRALNEETPISEIYGIIADILNLVVAFDYVSFVWIPRSENKAADALAKQALSNASFVASSMNPRV
ncbi:hypothetical protein Bca4012_006032 [Brassica carinata]